MDEFNNVNQGVENASTENNDAVAETASSEPEIVEVDSTDSGASSDSFAPYGDQDNSNPYGPYTGPVESEPGPKSTLAIVSLVCGIVGAVFSIVCGCCYMGWVGALVGAAGIVTGVINKKKNLPGDGMALAGIITGAVGVLIGVGQIVLLIISAVLSAASSM